MTGKKANNIALYCCALLICLIAAQAVVAKPKTASLLRTYWVADFSDFAPRTALDVVNRIPGFSFSEEEDERGFGQAASNVLVNGARVSGKNNGITNTLGRIPAANIERLDIYEGASLGIPGLSGEVVDVRVVASEVAGSWAWELQYRDHFDYVDPVFWDGEASLSGRNNTTSWTLAIINDYQRLGHGGPETKTAADGTLLEYRNENAAYDRDSPSFAVGLNFAPANGSVGNLALEYQQNWVYDIEERESTLPANRTFERKQNAWNVEFSGDYEFSLGSGRLKLMLIEYFSKKPTEATTVELSNGTFLVDNSFDRDQESGETILRSEYAWAFHRSEWQASLEAVYNYLDQESLFVNDTVMAGMFSVANDSKVEEQRYETALSYGQSIGKRSTVQASLGAEHSILEQTGDANQRRHFTRPKGFISYALAAQPRLNINWRLERTVGQLDFADFIASVDVGEGNMNAGNPDLVPEQAWKYEVKVDGSVDKLAAVSFRAFYEDLEDIVDQIPIGSDEEAVGNIDDAERYGAQWVSTFYFDALGWPGSTFDIDILTQKSRVKDPVTGQTRRINEDIIHKFDFELRHDIPSTDIAWGILHEVEREAPVFRIDEVSHDDQGDGLTSLYIEHKNIFGLTVKFTLRNITDRVDRFDRAIYDERRDGALLFVEERERTFGMYYILKFSGTF